MLFLKINADLATNRSSESNEPQRVKKLIQ